MRRSFVRTSGASVRGRRLAMLARRIALLALFEDDFRPGVARSALARLAAEKDLAEEVADHAAAIVDGVAANRAEIDARIAVEAPLTDWELDRYAAATLSQLQFHAAQRQITELKGRLQRINPVEEPEVYNRTYADLIRLEATARGHREGGISTLIRPGQSRDGHGTPAGQNTSPRRCR